MSKLLKLWIAIILFLVYPCSLVSLFAQAYAYPNIPDSIASESQRVYYFSQHFWDNADLADSTLLSEPKIVLDYLYLIQQLPNNDKAECIKSTIDKMLRHTYNYKLLLFWLERYLHNPHSPFFSDETFILVIDAILDVPISEGDKNALLYAKEVLLKNHIGAVAENFDFIGRDGLKMSLYEIEAPLLLLVFNSPDCSACHNLEKEISENDSIQQFVKEERLKILAISPMTDRDNWISHTYPSNWICGFDEEMTIIKEHLYEIGRFPSIYLLDKDKRVIIKEADYSLLIETLFSAK